MEINLITGNPKVELVQAWGGDLIAYKAARQSFGASEEPTWEEINGLIKKLVKLGHGTPFEHSGITVFVKCPIFVARQWVRHRMASYNEVSGRYTELKPDFFLPWSKQANPSAMMEPYREACQKAYDTYLSLIAAGTPKEAARGVLPVSIATQFYCSMNVRSLMNFFSLRLSDHAQADIRYCAIGVWDIFQEHMPITAQAFKVETIGDRAGYDAFRLIRG